MNLARTLLPVSILLAAAPARAQLSNRFLRVEAGVLAPLDGAGDPTPSLAVAAGLWLGGDLDLVARVAWASRSRTPGREADGALLPSVGLRWCPGSSSVRPEVHAEVGWTEPVGLAGGGLFAGMGLGLEVFPARDLSLGIGAALRAGAVPGTSAEIGISGTAYF